MKNVAIMSLSVLWAVVPLLAGCSTILKSADQGNLAKVDGHLQKGTGVDARDEYGRTPLMWGAEDLDVVRYLVEKGADVNARNSAGETPLMRAVRNLDVVKYLAEQGADVNAKDGKGESVLLKASVSGRVRTVQYLKQKGAAVEGGAR